MPILQTGDQVCTIGPVQTRKIKIKIVNLITLTASLKQADFH